MLVDATTHMFTEEALLLLRAELNRKDNPADFLAFTEEIKDDEQYLVRLKYPIEWSQPLEVDHEPRNAVSVFEDLGPRDRVVASDPRLWSYLAFVTHRSYMEQRRSLEGFYPRRVPTYWLMVEPKARNLVQHGIARLWWITNLTLDREFKYPLTNHFGNPYAYTSWVLANDDRRKYIFEGLIGRTPKLRWALMSALTENPDSLPSADAARRLAQRINIEAGFRNLQAMKEEELLDLARRELERILKAESKEPPKAMRQDELLGPTDSLSDRLF